MVFSSPVFLFLFLPLVVAAYFALPGIRARNLLLLFASLLFYSWGEIHYVIVLLVSICCNAWFGRRIEADRRRSLRWLWAAIVVNLVLLGYFKYANFLVENLNAGLGLLGAGPIEQRPVHLPLGISFFTFQALSYLVDVYRGTARAQRRIVDVALYISLFPQLIAGPIVRYGDVALQLTERRTTLDDAAAGIRRFSLGLAKKVLIANVLGQTADEIFAHPEGQLDPALAWLGIACYTLQIYFDFSGYSDMAIGLGRIFGFQFPENFNQPYTSRSVQEFWQRWHMSLSRWFRDYLYIPLGGNRLSPARTYLNLVTVFLLCGLWHGASWNFVLWGLFHGAFLVLERTSAGAMLRALPGIARRLYLLLVVMVGWVLFRAENLSQAGDFLVAMAFLGERTNDGYVMLFLTPKTVLALTAGILLCAIPGFTGAYDRLRLLPVSGSTVGHLLGWTRDLAIALLLVASAVMVSAQNYNPFIYFRF